jgi:hypothetical protein
MTISRILPLAIPVAQLWVRSQRKRHRFGDRARSLTDTESAVLLPFFNREVVRKVRVAEVPKFPAPWFYPLIRYVGISVPIMSHASAITLDDTIVVVRKGQPIPDWYSLLFHELVHVVQYSILGLDLFIDRYLRAFAAVGMDYDQNPFEREAYALQARFQSAPRIPFRVEVEVTRRSNQNQVGG